MSRLSRMEQLASEARRYAARNNLDPSGIVVESGVLHLGNGWKLVLEESDIGIYIHGKRSRSILHDEQGEVLFAKVVAEGERAAEERRAAESAPPVKTPNVAKLKAEAEVFRLASAVEVAFANLRIARAERAEQLVKIEHHERTQINAFLEDLRNGAPPTTKPRVVGDADLSQFDRDIGKATSALRGALEDLNTVLARDGGPTWNR